MMTLKKLFLFLIALLPIVMVSCGDDDDDDLIGKWYRVSDFDGLARSGTSSFTIGNKGYLVCGYEGKNWLSDLWEYDMDRDTWTQKANFPGIARNAGVAMTVDGKGYFGTGYGSSKLYLNDFWEYDAASNLWTQKADFPGSARYDAVAFSVSGKGYIGCGFDGNYLKDFYSYNPSSNSWQQIVSIGGSKRRGATGFVVNDKAYVCCGMNNGTYVDDFWQYDPSTESWTQLRDISDSSDDSYDDDYNIIRAYGVAFVIDGAVYLACGESGSVRTDTWKYTPSTDLWENVSKFKGSARTATVSFSNGERGFVVTGKSGTYYYDDIWELHPYEYDDDDY